MRRRIGERMIVARGDWGRTKPETLQAFADEVFAAAKKRRLRITELVFEGDFMPTQNDYSDEEVLRREPEEAVA